MHQARVQLIPGSGNSITINGKSADELFSAKCCLFTVYLYCL